MNNEVRPYLTYIQYFILFKIKLGLSSQDFNE
jgi:hypothetical protein